MEYGNGLGNHYVRLSIVTLNTAVGDMPTHWFRMKAYDIAREFGMCSVQLLCYIIVTQLWVEFSVLIHAYCIHKESMLLLHTHSMHS